MKRKPKPPIRGRSDPILPALVSGKSVRGKRLKLPVLFPLFSSLRGSEAWETQTYTERRLSEETHFDRQGRQAGTEEGRASVWKTWAGKSMPREEAFIISHYLCVLSSSDGRKSDFDPI